MERHDKPLYSAESYTAVVALATLPRGLGARWAEAAGPTRSKSKRANKRFCGVEFGFISEQGEYFSCGDQRDYYNQPAVGALSALQGIAAFLLNKQKPT